MDLARAPRRTARKKGSGYENESRSSRGEREGTGGREGGLGAAALTIIC